MSSIFKVMGIGFHNRVVSNLTISKHLTTKVIFTSVNASTTSSVQIYIQVIRDEYKETNSKRDPNSLKQIQFYRTCHSLNTLMSYWYSNSIFRTNKESNMIFQSNYHPSITQFRGLSPKYLVGCSY